LDSKVVRACGDGIVVTLLFLPFILFLLFKSLFSSKDCCVRCCGVFVIRLPFKILLFESVEKEEEEDKGKEKDKRSVVEERDNVPEIFRGKERGSNKEGSKLVREEEEEEVEDERSDITWGNKKFEAVKPSGKGVVIKDRSDSGDIDKEDDEDEEKEEEEVRLRLFDKDNKSNGSRCKRETRSEDDEEVE